MPEGQRKVYLSHLDNGEILARDVVNNRGHLIVPRDTVLSKTIVSRLTELGIAEVWVMDSKSIGSRTETDLYAEQKILPEIRNAFIDTVSKVESVFEQARIEERIDITSIQQSLHGFNNVCESEHNLLHLMIHLRSFDEYTFQHSVGVGLLSRKIGEWLGLSQQDCNDLMLSASLHDIGKSRIDPVILNKPGKLTAEEFEIMKEHTTFGYRILKNSDISERIALGAYGHHERMNGGGYPRKLTGDNIDLFSRIIAVADVFNAMTSRRVYKDSVSLYKVLDEVQSNAFGELDPRITTVFINKMTAFLTGNQVVLSDGTIGTVALVPSARPTRPLIQTNDGRFLDLQTHQELYIDHVYSVK